MNIVIVGAGRGLGRALVQGLGNEGDTLIGVSRQRPDWLSLDAPWIAADMAAPAEAATTIERAAPDVLDVLVYNVGVWEENAFSDDYRFLEDDDGAIASMVAVNVTAPLLLIKRLMPRLLRSSRPRLILTGSTSALRQSGRPEVTFGATKTALNGMADALREGFRDQGLGVTVLQLGYLNTEDDLSVPVDLAVQRDAGQTIPVHDVVAAVRMLLNLSDASFVRELVMPAIRDGRF